jgi:hypothetical protein
MSHVASEEKHILDNIRSKQMNMEEKKNTINQKAHDFEQKKKKQDCEGPQQFKIGDDIVNDTTEGFESVEGENDNEKKKLKENRKKAKQALKNKVEDYNTNKEPVNKTTNYKTDEFKNINPKEFVLGDYVSQAVDDSFAEIEKPDYSESSDLPIEKSVDLKSLTEPHADKISESSGVARTHTTEGINPDQFYIKDDFSIYEANDFSNNSQSNNAKGVNKDLKKKIFEHKIKNFNKQHDTKLNKDLDTRSEISVRLHDTEKRPKTAYKEEVSS